MRSEIDPYGKLYKLSKCIDVQMKGAAYLSLSVREVAPWATQGHARAQSA
jgi:hypothetical protein